MSTDESKAKKLMLLDEIFQEQPSLLLVKKLIDDLDIDGEEGEKGEKGEKGDTGEKGEKGDDGAPGKDGKNGTDGRDGRDGRDGEDGENGKDGSPDSPDEVVAKVNASSDKIQKDRIEGLDDDIKRIELVASQRVSPPGYSLTIQDDGVTVDKNTRYINFTGGTVTRSASGIVTVPLGGGSGVSSWSSAPETVDGILDTFTIPTTAVDVVTNGILRFETFDFDRAGTQVTFYSPPTDYVKYR